MSPRWTFASLWLSQCCRFFSDYALRLFVVQETTSQFAKGGEAAWHTVVAIFMVPAALLPPVYGVISNTYPKRNVLFASALMCLLVLLPFLPVSNSAWWFLAIGLVSLGSSLYSPTRHAMLPAAAHELGWPLPRVMGIIEMGAILSMVLGMATGSHLQGSSGSQWGLPFSPALVIILLTSLLCVLLSANTRFTTDQCRPESLRQAIAGFFCDLRQLVTNRSTSFPLLGVASLRGLVTAAAGAFVADALTRSSGGKPPLEVLLGIAFASTIGMAIGSMLAGLISGGDKPLRWIPLNALLLTLTMLLGAVMTEKPAWILFIAGLFGGLLNVPLLSAYQAATPADARGNAMAILNSLGCFSMALVSGVFAGLAWMGLLPPDKQFWLVTVLGAIASFFAWQTMLPSPSRREGPGVRG